MSDTLKTNPYWVKRMSRECGGGYEDHDHRNGECDLDEFDPCDQHYWYRYSCSIGVHDSLWWKGLYFPREHDKRRADMDFKRPQRRASKRHLHEAKRQYNGGGFDEGFNPEPNADTQMLYTSNGIGWLYE